MFDRTSNSTSRVEGITIIAQVELILVGQLGERWKVILMGKFKNISVESNIKKSTHRVVEVEPHTVASASGGTNGGVKKCIKTRKRTTRT